MLQQTRVATVIPYYQRFLARFPTVEALAAADEDDVLALWSGLGYYSRGRNLHRAARVVAEELDGEFPSTAEELRALPGIGPYTAAAIASLAFGQRATLVDGNVERVLARLCDDATPKDSSEGKTRTHARATELVEVAEDPAALNEALMELGALVCTPKSPSCDECPWRDACQGRASGRAPQLPTRRPRAARKPLRVACALVFDGEWVWLEKRATRGLFGGLYEPPARELSGRASARAAILSLLHERGLPAPSRLPRTVRVERTLTHRDLKLDVVAVQAERGRRRTAPWFHRDALGDVGLSSAVRAVLSAAWPGA